MSVRELKDAIETTASQSAAQHQASATQALQKYQQVQQENTGLKNEALTLRSDNEKLRNDLLGAQQEADKAWMQTARWQWGERYMAREHADDATYECGRSSVGSVVGQVFYRCRLTAKPCRPDASPGK